jgi:hypothetical protein
MKKYSNYFKICMVLAIATAVCAYIAPLAELCVIMCVVSFLFWYAGIMAPDHEKYKQDYYTEEELRLAIMKACDLMEKGKPWNESCWEGYNLVAKTKKSWSVETD